MDSTQLDNRLFSLNRQILGLFPSWPQSCAQSTMSLNELAHWHSRLAAAEGMNHKHADILACDAEAVSISVSGSTAFQWLVLSRSDNWICGNHDLPSVLHAPLRPLVSVSLPPPSATAICLLQAFGDNVQLPGNLRHYCEGNNNINAILGHTSFACGMTD